MPENNSLLPNPEMPGPQFGKVPASKNWLRGNYQKLVMGGVIVLLAVAGYFFYQNYRQNQIALGPILKNANLTVSPTSLTASPTVSPAQSDNLPVKGARITETPTPPQTATLGDNQNIIATAAKGNGVTHLARAALKEYARKNNLDLKKEQKIYIEDYLRKHVARAGTLKPGDTISFSDSLMKDAIDRVQQLTDKQIQNLSQYVPLVPSL